MHFFISSNYSGKVKSEKLKSKMLQNKYTEGCALTHVRAHTHTLSLSLKC